jgi:hydroxyacylglutathione hydrolase
MHVEIVPCLTDNYAYIVVAEVAEERESGRVAVVVDACEEGPIVAALERLSVTPVAILATHHHFDHVGGNLALAARYPGLSVHGHVSEHGRIPGMSTPHAHGDRFALAGLSIEVLHVPGHTLGAVTWLVGPETDDTSRGRWAFTGDTLFLAGCGRLFEGTAAQMHGSLSALAALGDDVLVACGHEYTAANLRFAAHVEPDHAPIRDRRAEVAALRDAGRPTVPSPMARERETNPFLRTSAPSVRAHVGLPPDAPASEVLAALRREKDGFR